MSEQPEVWADTMHEPESRKLALEAIAGMSLNGSSPVIRERLTLCVAIARVELAKTAQEMLDAMPTE